MRRIGEYLGLLEDTGRYDDEYADEYDTYEGQYADQYAPETAPVAVAKPSRRELREARQQATVANLDDRRRGGGGGVATMTAAPRVAELSKITTLHPRTYNEARTIGEHFREGTPVIMNLTEMVDSDARRLVDFAAGLIFGLRGSIDRVTNKVFLLSPANVEVGAEDKARIAERNFFNQS